MVYRFRDIGCRDQAERLVKNSVEQPYTCVFNNVSIVAFSSHWWCLVHRSNVPGLRCIVTPSARGRRHVWPR
jgi:hypothetical protein